MEKFKLKAYQTLYLDTPGKDFTNVRLAFEVHNFEQGDMITYNSDGICLYVSIVDGGIIDTRVVSNDRLVYLPKYCLEEGALWYNKSLEVEKRVESNELSYAIKVLQKHLSEDKSEGSYYHTWQANIAMSIYDEYCEQAKGREYIDLGKLDIHEICNTGAKNFLDLLIKGLWKE